MVSERLAGAIRNSTYPGAFRLQASAAQAPRWLSMSSPETIPPQRCPANLPIIRPSLPDRHLQPVSLLSIEADFPKRRLVRHSGAERRGPACPLQDAAPND
jgi:hypothetical protein